MENSPSKDWLLTMVKCDVMVYVPAHQPRKERQGCVAQFFFVIICAMALMLLLYLGLDWLGV